MSKKQETPARTLDDILKDIPGLDEDSAKYTETVQSISNSAGGSKQIIYDEQISTSLARALLGGDFDPACRYQIVTDEMSMVVVKIDDAYPADREPVYDAHGNILKSHIMEYPLEQTADDGTQSYADMMNTINSHKPEKNYKDPNVYRDTYEKKRRVSPWLVGFAFIMGALLAVWIVLLFIIF